MMPASRRFPQRQQVYGKRKSSFYGENDSDKATGAEGEDYSGPGGGSYFVLSKERTNLAG